MLRVAHLIRYGLVAAATFALASGAAAQTVKFVPHADLKILDTTWTNALITSHHGNMVYDTLFSYDSKMNAKPQMVESFSRSPDGLVWSFTRRKGMTFHDGSPVTAKDAVASLNRWSKRRVEGTAMMERAASLVAKDDLTFVLTLKEPFAPILSILGTAWYTAIVPYDFAPENNLNEKASGTGPFKLVEYIPNDHVTLTANANYWEKGFPCVDGIRYDIIPDQQAQSSAFRQGNADSVELSHPKLIRKRKSGPDSTPVEPA